MKGGGLNATLTELSAALAAKKVSAMELTRAHLQRIHSHRELNAFITVDEEMSIDAAKRADERRAKGEAGPLTGIPIAHKDIFCTRELRTTCASRMLENTPARTRACREQFGRAGRRAAR